MAIAATATARAERSLPTAGLFVLAIGSLDLGLEQSLVLPALPALARHYQSSLIATSWVATGYLLATVVAIPLLGRLGDLFGKRRLLLAALAAFAVGGLVCALSDSIGVVIGGRVVQGIGGGAGALTLGLLRDAVPPGRLPQAIGVVIGGISAGGATGFVLSGMLVDHISVRAIFWFLAGLSLVLMVGAYAFVPESPLRARVPIDVVGAALLGAGLTALLLAISKGNTWHWASARVLALFAASAAFLAAFAVAESRVRRPIVDLALVRTRPFAAANVCAFAAGYAFFVVLIVVPQLAAMPTASGYGFGYSTTRTGLLLLPSALLSMGAAWVAGRALDRVGPRVIMAAGSAVGVVAYVSLAVAHGDAALLALLASLVGVTFGFSFTAIASVVVRAAPVDKTSIAAGVNGVVRTTATAVAAAAAAALVTAAGLRGPFPAEPGFTRSFAMGAIACGFGFVAAVLLPRRTTTARAGY